jgi:hypothetical protein
VNRLLMEPLVMAWVVEYAIEVSQVGVSRNPM